jgi:glycine C-acetyltransferase
METEPQHVKNLWENTRYWKKQLASLGFDIGNSVTPITPVMCGEAPKAKELSDHLFSMGVFGFPIVFPMVARDKARIRTMITAGLTRPDLDEALRAFEAGGKKVGLL